MFRLNNFKDEPGYYGCYITTDEGKDDPWHTDEVEMYGDRLVAESVSPEFAYLLAASKMLLDACEDALPNLVGLLLERWGPQDQWPQDAMGTRTVIKLKEAIAKARGEEVTG